LTWRVSTTPTRRVFDDIDPLQPLLALKDDRYDLVVTSVRRPPAWDDRYRPRVRPAAHRVCFSPRRC
jgi:hypothetical protein